MKKILFLLLCTVSIYGQTSTGQEQDFDYGIKNTASQLDDNALFITVQNSDGVQGKSTSSVWAKKIYVDNADVKKAFLSTGLIKNGLVQANADPTKFNITAGIGIISNFDDPENPTSTIVNFPAFTGITPTYLTSGNITYIAINSSSAIVMQATPFTNIQRRDYIILGAVIHSNLTTINLVNNISAPTNADTNQLHDLMEAIGALNVDGNKIVANNANLSINKTAGDIFKLGVNFANDWKNPHKLNLPLQTLATFRYRTQNGTEGANVTVLNPALYDVANVLTSVPSNRFSIQTVTLFQTGAIRVQYGQATYATLSEAESAINTRTYNVEPNIAANGITRAYIILKNTATSLQNASDTKIVEAGKFGNVGGSGGAITLDAIVAALGFTPENVANKQNSLTVDGTGQKFPTIDAVNKAISFVTPEQYGAVADGVTDDKTAMQNAINSGKLVMLNGSYYSSGTIIVSNKTTIYGNGKIIIDQNLPAMSIQSNYVNIKGITIQGNGRGVITDYSTIRPLQNGILVDGFYFNNNVDGVIFNNLGNSGILVKNNTIGSAIVDNGVKISNCTFVSSLYGIYLDTYGEYNTTINCIFKSNETGIVIKGGNNSTIGGHVINNRTGVSILPGTNDGHSTMTSTTINHNTDFAISVGAITNGFVFESCVIFDDKISIIGSTGVSFNGGEYNITLPIIITNTTATTFKNISFKGSGASTTLSGNTALRFFNNSNGSGFSTNSMRESISTLDFNGNNSANSFIKIMDNSVNRFIFGSDAGITGGVAGDINSFVYGSNNYFISTNNVKRFGISGTGRVSLFTDPTTSTGTYDILTRNTSTGVVEKKLNADFVHTSGDEVIGGTKSFSSGSIKLYDTSFGGYNTINTSVDAFNFKNTSNSNIFSVGNGIMDLYNSTGLFYASFSTIPLTADRTLTLPNASGTIALVETVKPYKVYTALLSQSGTSAPTATVLENTLGGTIVWSRSSTGIYIGTLSGAFTANKTLFGIMGIGALTQNTAAMSAYVQTINGVRIDTTLSGTFTDAMMTSVPIEIRVYN